METYKIIRFHKEKPKRVVRRGLTKEEAIKHCTDSTTHKIDKNGNVVWFDGFTKE